MSEKKRNVPIYIEESLLERLDRAAHNERRSRNGFVIEAIHERLDRLGVIRPEDDPHSSLFVPPGLRS